MCLKEEIAQLLYIMIFIRMNLKFKLNSENCIQKISIGKNTN